MESLEAILMDDVNILRNPESGFPELIETTVLPTVGGDTTRQYVCVTLQVIPEAGYPDVKPKFKLRNPRGLSESTINAIEEAMRAKLDKNLGQAVIFDLIEIVREHLTESNLPSGSCVVCLYGFCDGDEFTKTICYHYLHSYCLARHLHASKRNYHEEHDKLPAWQKLQAKPFQATCPVCREPISDKVEPLNSAQPPLELENAPNFQLTDEIRDLQTKMQDLFLRQKSRGGIIDVDAEENNVISIDNDEDAQDGQKASDTSPDEPSETPHTPTRRGGNFSHQRGITRSSHQRSHQGGNHHHNNYRRHSNRSRRAASGRDQPCGSHPR
ncbi:E3 ubiquitin-protein ligase RNF25 [Sergentomyia squamirostris]